MIKQLRAAGLIEFGWVTLSSVYKGMKEGRDNGDWDLQESFGGMPQTCGTFFFNPRPLLADV